MLSAMISVLHRMLSKLESFLPMPVLPTPNGMSGHSTAMSMALSHSSKMWLIQFLSSKSSYTSTELATYLPTDNPSALGSWLPYRVLPRHSLVWGPWTHALTAMAKLTSICVANLPHMERSTPHHTVSNPFWSPFYSTLHMWHKPAMTLTMPTLPI